MYMAKTLFSTPYGICYNECGKKAAMNRKQKEQLRFLLKARKRADKVLAERREAKLKKLDHERRLEANQELKKQYTQDLTALAEESGVLAMARNAALQRGGDMTQQLSCYVDYGINSSRLVQTYAVAEHGELRPSHLAVRVTWEESGIVNEVEVRVHRKGQITFHNSFLPVFRFVWHRYPRLLHYLFDSALAHPTCSSLPTKPRS